MSKKTIFNVEITDTYGGEANYCWVRRFTVKASSFRGAMQVISRKQGGHWRLEGNYGDIARYNQKGACVCAFVSYAE